MFIEVQRQQCGVKDVDNAVTVYVAHNHGLNIERVNGTGFQVSNIINCE